MSSTADYPSPAPQDPNSRSGGHPSGPLPQVPASSNSVATAGLVVGVIAAALALIPLVGMISWLLGPLAVVLGGAGVQRADRHGGLSAARGAVGLGVLALVICVLWVAAFTSSTSSSSSTSGSSSYSSPYTAPYSAPGYSAPSYTSPDYSSPSYGSSVPATPPGPLTSVSSGTYEVGTGAGEIEPGKYVAAAGSSSCYYARLKNLDGELGSIIDNKAESGGGQVIMTVKSSDAAVEISGDCTFAKR